MWFSRKLLRIPWTEHMNNKEVLRKLERGCLYLESKRRNWNSKTHNEEGKLTKFATHRTYWKQDMQRETVYYLPNKRV